MPCSFIWLFWLLHTSCFSNKFTFRYLNCWLVLTYDKCQRMVLMIWAVGRDELLQELRVKVKLSPVSIWTFSFSGQEKKGAELVPIHFLFLFKLILLKYTWFTVLWSFLLYRKVVQLYIHIYILFHVLFHYGLSQDIEYSSLCHTVGPCCLSILYMIVCNWLASILCLLCARCSASYLNMLFHVIFKRNQ